MTNQTLIELKKKLSEQLSRPWRVRKFISSTRLRQKVDQLHASINHQKQLLREYEVTKKIESSMASYFTNQDNLKARSAKHKKYKQKKRESQENVINVIGDNRENVCANPESLITTITNHDDHESQIQNPIITNTDIDMKQDNSPLK